MIKAFGFDLSALLPEKRVVVGAVDLEMAQKTRLAKKELEELKEEFRKKLTRFHEQLKEEYTKALKPIEEKHDAVWESIYVQLELDKEKIYSVDCTDGTVYQILHPGDVGYTDAEDEQHHRPTNGDCH